MHGKTTCIRCHARAFMGTLPYLRDPDHAPAIQPLSLIICIQVQEAMRLVGARPFLASGRPRPRPRLLIYCAGNFLDLQAAAAASHK
eukprot:1137273-Pelagomonas_calceolata.AAC.4